MRAFCFSLHEMDRAIRGSVRVALNVTSGSLQWSSKSLRDRREQLAKCNLLLHRCSYSAKAQRCLSVTFPQLCLWPMEVPSVECSWFSCKADRDASRSERGWDGEQSMTLTGMGHFSPPKFEVELAGSSCDCDYRMAPTASEIYCEAPRLELAQLARTFCVHPHPLTGVPSPLQSAHSCSFSGTVFSKSFWPAMVSLSPR